MASEQSQADQRLQHRVGVSIGPEAAEQISLAGAQRLPEMVIQAVRENGVELSSEIFLPRNCVLEIEYRLSRGNQSPDSAASAPRSVRGVVRRVRTVSSAPAYSLWVRPDEREPDDQEAWRLLLDCRPTADTEPKDG